jgi:hypothetical protein
MPDVKKKFRIIFDFQIFQKGNKRLIREMNAAKLIRYEADRWCLRVKTLERKGLMLILWANQGLKNSSVTDLIKNFS